MERLENLIKYDILKQKENLFIIDAKYYLINKNDISSLLDGLA